jgi:hypothetical protein
MSEDRIPLVQLPRKLAEHRGHSNPSDSYRSLYSQVVDGKIPAEQMRGRWYVQPSHIPAIAEALSSKRRDEGGPQAAAADGLAAA